MLHCKDKGIGKNFSKKDEQFNTIMAQHSVGTVPVLTFMERKILDMTRWVVLSVQLAFKGAAFFTQIKNLPLWFSKHDCYLFSTLGRDTSMQA
jgi:hypothetical protein